MPGGVACVLCSTIYIKILLSLSLFFFFRNGLLSKTERRDSDIEDKLSVAKGEEGEEYTRSLELTGTHSSWVTTC